jgi:hypothetical protein
MTLVRRSLCLLLLLAWGCATAAPRDRGDRADGGGVDDGSDGAPRAPKVVRRAPVDVTALVNAAPTTAGVGADPATDAMVAVAQNAGLVAVADPQLSRLAKAILLMVLDEQAPSALLGAAMADRLGVGGAPSHSFAVGDGAPTTAAQELSTVVKDLGAGTRVRVGVATAQRDDGQSVTLVAITPTPLAVDAFERKRAPGDTLALTGTWADPKRALKYYVDDGAGGVKSGDVDVDDRGAIAFAHPLPKTPGVVRLEFVSTDDAEVERDVYAVSVYVGDVPVVVDNVDAGVVVDAASVVAAVNGVRGGDVLVDSPLLVRALATPDERALRAHFAGSGKLVRHMLTQTFTGVFTAGEFAAMTSQSPWARAMFARDTANAIGVVVDDQGAEGKTVRVFTADVRDSIHVPSEQKRALDGINRARAKAKQKALTRDEQVEPVLQAYVEKLCRGEADVSDSGALQVALDPTLRKRRYSSLATFSANGDDIPGTSWARNFAEVKSADYNVAAVGACSGAHAAAGQKNAVLVVVLLGKR